jgi:hypothetical protein
MHSVQQSTREARQNAEFIPKVSSTEALCTAGRVLHGGNSDSNDSYSRSKRLSLPIGEGNNNAHAQTGATTPDSSARAEYYSSAVAGSHSTTNKNIVAHSPALGKARAAALLLKGMKIEQQQERRNNSLRFKPELEKKIDTTTICNTHAQHTGLPKINYSDSKNYKGCMNKHMRRIVVDSSDDVLDTNNTNIKQLQTRKYNQKEINIADRLKESKFVFISDNIILYPFNKGLTRFISSCMTANRVPIYVCVACSYHTRVKSHFNHHHLTQKHMNNLDTWSIRQIKIETNNDRYTHTNSCISTQDNLESQISSNIQIEERIEPVHERKNSNEKIAIEPVHERKNSNAKIAISSTGLDDIPIPWKLNTIQNNKDMTFNEIILLKSHQLALIKVKKDLPKNFGTKIIDLMKAMYQKRNLNESIIEISNTFLYSNHWIAYKFNDLINTFNSREYLIEKWSDSNYQFIQKTQKQDYEIRDISGAARILYDILIPSSVSVSIEYLCMLAVLMTQDGNKKFWSAKLTLENNQIDLLMEKGIIVFKNHEISDHRTKNVYKKDNETENKDNNYEECLSCQ